MSEEAAADHKPERIEIQIDRVHYEPPIGPDRDLFEVVPGHSDRKIENNEEVDLRNGTRFFTAPAHINPGQSAR
jgi:hypothetical protein